ncbi:hypothetical protein ACQP1P_24390 [Dactylosporangium sp. CA-052675]|uniref:hypothetical protein n=1 Tax=Dactylosporangium sp. CA-052675 TaxID=3239927 RepID=UPI003D8B86FD
MTKLLSAASAPMLTVVAAMARYLVVEVVEQGRRKAQTVERFPTIAIVHVAIPCEPALVTDVSQTVPAPHAAAPVQRPPPRCGAAATAVPCRRRPRARRSPAPEALTTPAALPRPRPTRGPRHTAPPAFTPPLPHRSRRLPAVKEAPRLREGGGRGASVATAQAGRNRTAVGAPMNQPPERRLISDHSG